MQLFLQCGYGMMDHCRALLGDWGGGTAILSPRDLTDVQLKRLASDVRKLSGSSVLVDPQFYLPYADHARLCSHDYWPKDYESGAFWQGQELTRLLTKLKDLNDELQTEQMILPGMLAGRIDADWFTTQEMILEEARTLLPENRIAVTVALSADAIRQEDQLASLIERAESWKAPWYYVIAEHPNGNYLVDDPIWLANVLDLAAALRLYGSKVILGYCNHQMLIASCANVTAIASGTWMNVRSFPPDKCRAAYDDEIKQRSTWYYAPHALSEYKIPFLDIANRLGVLPSMQPPPELGSHYANALFTGVQPTSVNFTEQAAFRHYLTSLRGQVARSTHATYAATVSHHEALLGTAETILRVLGNSGVSGQRRDFRDVIDVNRAALNLFGQTRGTMLGRKWPTLIE